MFAYNLLFLIIELNQFSIFHQMNFIKDIYKTYGTKIILSLVFLVGICFYYFSFDGYNFYDDLAYMKYAYQLLTNTFHLTSDNFCHRFGLIIPTLLFYKLFGLNDITTTLFVLICWIGSVYLCFKVFSSSSLSLMIAVILSGLDYYHLFFVLFFLGQLAILYSLL